MNGVMLQGRNSMPSEFRTFLRELGILAPDALISDGRIHRCGVVGHERSKSGAYQIFPDLFGGGGENWTTGSKWQKWTSRERDRLTPDERAKMAALIADLSHKRAAERAAQAIAAAKKAATMWKAAKETRHPYLDRKGICSAGTRVLGKLLLIPVRDADGTLRSLQMVAADGTKRFLRGGDVSGCFTWLRIGEASEPRIYVCEGLATGTTIHAAMKCAPVAVAFSCGNLLPVARLLRQRYPRGRFTICADNDHRTDGNPGVRHATAAARDIRARIAVPMGMDGTDFNDLMTERGLDWVAEQLRAAKIPTEA